MINLNISFILKLKSYKTSIVKEEESSQRHESD